jgi:thiol-disulfide isomerase/thioredoxin
MALAIDGGTMPAPALIIATLVAALLGQSAAGAAALCPPTDSPFWQQRWQPPRDAATMARERRVVEAALRHDPGDIDAAWSELAQAPMGGDAWRRNAARYAAIAERRRDDSRVLAVAGRMLWGYDTPRALDVLERSVALDAHNGLAHATLMSIYGVGRFRDDAAHDREAAAVREACPMTLSGYTVSDSAHAATVDATLAELDEVVASMHGDMMCRAQSFRWSLMRRAAGESSQKNGELAGDIQRWLQLARERSRTMAPSGECLLAMRDGYERAGDAGGVAWSENEIVRRFAASDPAEEYARAAFERSNVARGRTEGRQGALAYYSALADYATRLLALRPADVRLLVERTRALALVDAPASSVDAAARAAIAALPGDDAALRGYPMPEAVIASALARRVPHSRAIDALLARADAALASAATQAAAPFVDYLADASGRALEDDRSQIIDANRWLVRDVRATRALTLGDLPDAARMCRMMDDALAGADRVAAERGAARTPVDSRLRTVSMKLDAKCHGALALAQHRDAEAATIYRGALVTPMPQSPAYDPSVDWDLAAGYARAARQAGLDPRPPSSISPSEAAASSKPSGEWIATDRAAPPLDFHGADGRRWSLDVPRGKVVLVNFWATWCSGCVLELPYIAKLQARAHDAGGIVVISASLDDDRGRVTAFLARNRYAMDVSMVSLAQFLKVTGAPVLPQTWVIDRGGRIRYTTNGVDGDVAWVDATLAMLGRL